jgi:hypothetical protein
VLSGRKIIRRSIIIYNSTSVTHSCTASHTSSAVFSANRNIPPLKGDANEVYSPENAFLVQEQLVNAKDGAKLYLIRGILGVYRACAQLTCGPGSQGYLGVVPESASIANRVFASFLARLPPARSDPLPPHPKRLDDALRRLAEIKHDPDICMRDPCSPMAFSCVPAMLVRWRMQIYAKAAAGHRGAFSPLDRSGRPKRRYVAHRYCHSSDVHPWRSDILSGCRNNGLKWTETGCPTQVCAEFSLGFLEM